MQFISLLDLANLTQHVSFPTHRFNHTLDLVITQADSTLCPVISQCPISPSDHFPILYSLNILRPPSSPISKHLTRAIHSINIERFTRDIISSRLITHPPSNLSDLIDCYNSTLTNLLDKHAPLISKITRTKPPQPWFTPTLNKLKSAKRRLERTYGLNLTPWMILNYYGLLLIIIMLLS